MLRTNLVTSRRMRVCFFGFTAITTATIFTSDIAEARRYRHVYQTAADRREPNFLLRLKAQERA